MFDLYDARVIARKTYTELSRASGLTPKKIGLIEKGRIKPTPDEKRRLANALALRPFEIDWQEKREEAVSC